MFGTRAYTGRADRVPVTVRDNLRTNNKRRPASFRYDRVNVPRTNVDAFG